MTAKPNPASRRRRKSPTNRTEPDDTVDRYVYRHLRFGLWSLLVFLSMGIALETLHGLKVSWYVNVDWETRRLMWTLAHAHGTLLSLIHLIFSTVLKRLTAASPKRRSVMSACLITASLLLPGGFFLGGTFIHAGDPGLGVLLVPAGGGCLFVAVLLAALSARRDPPMSASPDASPRNPSTRSR